MPQAIRNTNCRSQMNGTKFNKTAKAKLCCVVFVLNTGVHITFFHTIVCTLSPSYMSLVIQYSLKENGIRPMKQMFITSHFIHFFTN